MSKVSIVLPAFNEEETIGKVLDEVPYNDFWARYYEWEVLVVDNASSDKTRSIALDSGATVVSCLSRGKGNAMRQGFAEASGDFIFMADSDYTYPLDYIPLMLTILESGVWDIVRGSRLLGTCEPGAITTLNRIGNDLLTLMANLLYSGETTDLCTGLWGFTSQALKGMHLTSKKFELEAEMFIQASKKGYRVTEIPINYRCRPNRPKLHSLGDGFQIGLTLLKGKVR